MGLHFDEAERRGEEDGNWNLQVRLCEEDKQREVEQWGCVAGKGDFGGLGDEEAGQLSKLRDGCEGDD